MCTSQQALRSAPYSVLLQGILMFGGCRCGLFLVQQRRYVGLAFSRPFFLSFTGLCFMVKLSLLSSHPPWYKTFCLDSCPDGRHYTLPPCRMLSSTHKRGRRPRQKTTAGMQPASASGGQAGAATSPGPTLAEVGIHGSQELEQ